MAAAYKNDFDVEQAKRYVALSGIAYCGDPLISSNNVDTWTCKACKKFPGVNATAFKGSLATDALGYVAYDPSENEIVIAFAGTDPKSIRNWIDDLSTLKTDYPYCSSTNCQVHKGFYRSYQSTDAVVKSLLESYLSSHPGASIAITGHSLGAALAAHALAELTQAGYKIKAPYTYGMPRVGDEAFEMWYKSTLSGTYRVTHHKDPVPHVPTKSMGFHHMPYEVSACMLIFDL